VSQSFDDDTPAFSLTRGGPFYRLLQRYRIVTPTSTIGCWWLAALVWLPYSVGEAVRAAYDLDLDPAVFDISTHVRILLALPIMLISERLLETTARSAMSSFAKGEFCDPTLWEPILVRAQRLRDSWFAELVLLLVAVLGGQLVLWGVFGASGLFHGGGEMHFWSFPRIWYAVIALPLFQFVLFRWLWHWLIWSTVLARVSRLPLHVLATHPDYAGGLTLFARPVTAFAGLLFATSAVVSAAWGTKLIYGYATLRELVPGLVAFLVTATVVGFGPLLSFSGTLFRMRRRTLAAYGAFARHYILDFHQKWIASPREKSALGTSDIQSLADLGNSYQIASKTRLIPFAPRIVLGVWIAGIVPMLPLLASRLTAEQVLKRIIATVLGGFPM
jgi:hypothetical protein